MEIGNKKWKSQNGENEQILRKESRGGVVLYGKAMPRDKTGKTGKAGNLG